MVLSSEGKGALTKGVGCFFAAEFRISVNEPQDNTIPWCNTLKGLWAVRMTVGETSLRPSRKKSPNESPLARLQQGSFAGCNDQA